MAKITAVRTIRTRVTGTWVIVKIETDQPGLYGIGSAHNYNATGAVVAAIEEWFAPRLIGRDAGHIEDLWQTTYQSGYWRTGPTHNVALGGIDIALWDIKGKEAGLPVYQLLGGPCRAAVPCYAHAHGATLPELEDDVLPPEQIAYFRQIRQQCTTPQAMGELFTNVQEYLPLISERLIDFIRVRVSKAGGITLANKIAHLCEFFGVQTAWQEGGNTDPVNLTAAMHLDLASWNFGIQEENHFRPEELDAFPGHPILERGYLYANDRPGLGIDVDEAKAARLVNPERARTPRYVAEDRKPDGTVVRP